MPSLEATGAAGARNRVSVRSPPSPKARTVLFGLGIQEPSTMRSMAHRRRQFATIEAADSC